MICKINIGARRNIGAKQAEEYELPQIVNMPQAKVESIHADLVRTGLTAIRQIESE